MDPSNRETSFKNTGAVEQDRPEQKTNVAPLDEQLDHRYQDPLNKANDSGLPGHGQTPEFTGEEQMNNQLDKDTNADLTKGNRRDPDGDNPEAETVNQDPGESQKRNQGGKIDDDLAA